MDSHVTPVAYSGRMDPHTLRARVSVIAVLYLEPCWIGVVQWYMFYCTMRKDFVRQGKLRWGGLMYSNGNEQLRFKTAMVPVVHSRCDFERCSYEDYIPSR